MIKEICKKCVNKCARQEKAPSNFVWCVWEEGMWKEDLVCCPAEDWDEIGIFDPPESCHYKLEQTVLNEKPDE